MAKYSSELVIKQLCKVNNVEYVILVPHNIIGTRQKYDDPFRNVASIMINRMLQEKQPIIYGNGEQKRCFSFIDDVVYCLQESLTRKSVVNETINIGPDEEFVTINYLAKTIADILNFNLKPIYVLDRPNEVKLAYCSSNKARKLLDYNTKIKLRSGLEKMVDYIKEHGTKEFKYNINLEIVNEKTPKTWSEKLI
ncbi:MAG TPA: NAD-dependent epimerase/dehydratase family protein [Rickettsiales bacterium]|nr:NAD-dependent epimerase/dehydratase family protein [Rickettsiales bacterium]